MFTRMSRNNRFCTSETHILEQILLTLPDPHFHTYISDRMSEREAVQFICTGITFFG
jgi:hypothetical protein